MGMVSKEILLSEWSISKDDHSSLFLALTCMILELLYSVDSFLLQETHIPNDVLVLLRIICLTGKIRHTVYTLKSFN